METVGTAVVLVLGITTVVMEIVGTAVVLVVGLSTVGFQFFTARRDRRIAEQQLELGKRVAEQQLKASKAQLEASKAAHKDEQRSIILVTRGGSASKAGELHVYNGGRFSAMNLLLTFQDDKGRLIGEGYTPMVRPAGEERVLIKPKSTGGLAAFKRRKDVFATWYDGLKTCEMFLDIRDL